MLPPPSDYAVTLRTIRDLSGALRAERRRLRLTQYDVAAAASVSQALLSQVERERSSVNVRTLLRLLHWLQLASVQPTPAAPLPGRPAPGG